MHDISSLRPRHIPILRSFLTNSFVIVIIQLQNPGSSQYRSIS
ncbi:MAG: hypothetical protein OJF51_002651 [Nitrospira sp.]|nr:MAG: hypothetical protein OJF51_002651 [Nitrospira sp.]